MECLFLPAKLRDSGVVARKKGEKENGESGGLPCGLPDCTLRRILEYLPQSTRVLAAKYAGGLRKAWRGVGQGRGRTGGRRAQKIPVAGEPPRGESLYSNSLTLLRDYLISIIRLTFAFSSGVRFGRSMVSTPSFTLAAIFSLSTSSGKTSVCSNCV